jgi:hypothetical protein
MTTTITPEAEVTEVTKGLGGQPTTGEPEPKAAAAKPAPAPRYAEDMGDLPDRVLAARKATGRTKLAELLDISPSAVWRAEQSRIHPSEAAGLRERLSGIEDRIAAGEFAKQAKTGRVDRAVELLRKAQGDKAVTRAQLIEELLVILAPTDAPKA